MNILENPPQFPLRLEIELASACNLRCVYCPRKYLDNLKGFMDFGLFKKIVDEAARYPNTIIVLHRRGESLLHPQFAEICKYVQGKFKEIQIATNATLLDEEKSKLLIETVTFISFSIDVPEVFDKTRIPAKYKDVEKNILRFLNLNNGRVRTQVSMVKTATTPEENVELFKRIWHAKVDRIRIYEEHSIDGKFGKLARSRENRVPCVMPFYEMLIYDDGRVGRCNHDWDSSPMGDVNKSSIKDIWHSDKYKDLRRQHLRMEITDEQCKNCDSWYPKVGFQETGEVLE